MSRTTIKKMYDIATVFLTDSKTHIAKDVSKRYYTVYTLTKDNLTLQITAPHGSPEWNPDFNRLDINAGSIDLYGGVYYLMRAQTVINVGCAMNRPRTHIVHKITRMLSPYFFKLLDMAELRHSGQLATRDNTSKIYYQISRMNKRQK